MIACAPSSRCPIYFSFTFIPVRQVFLFPHIFIMMGFHSQEVKSLLLAQLQFRQLWHLTGGAKAVLSAEYLKPGEELWCDMM